MNGMVYRGLWHGVCQFWAKWPCHPHILQYELPRDNLTGSNFIGIQVSLSHIRYPKKIKGSVHGRNGDHPTIFKFWSSSWLRTKRQEADIFTLLSRPSAGHHGHLYSEEHDQSGHCLWLSGGAFPTCLWGGVNFKWTKWLYFSIQRGSYLNLWGLSNHSRVHPVIDPHTPPQIWHERICAQDFPLSLSGCVWNWGMYHLSMYIYIYIYVYKLYIYIVI